MASNPKMISIFLIFLVFLCTKALSQCEDETNNPCNNKSKALELKFIGIATILITSIIGVCLPLITQSVPALSPDRSLFVIIKAFASGFILATAFMIVLPGSYGMLSSNCLADVPWHKFPFTSFVAMVSAIFTLMVDSMVTSMYTNKKKNEMLSESSELAANDQETVITTSGEMHLHGHHHRQKGTIGQQLQRYHVVAMMLELGIVVHSIVIGLGLGASNDTCAIKSLVAALCFYQLFEGMGLGGCIFQDEYKKMKKTVIVFLFTITIPMGIAFGIALSKTYTQNSPTALITVGLLNASSSGILIYMALANLLSADFMGPKLQGNMKLQIMAYTAVLLGAGGLSLMENGLTVQLSSQSIFKKQEFGPLLTNRERGISFIAL